MRDQPPDERPYQVPEARPERTPTPPWITILVWGLIAASALALLWGWANPPIP